MSKLWALTSAVLATLVLAVVPAAAASAATDDTFPDSPGREVTRWDQTLALQSDGSMDVTLEIDFDFGNDPGHGPFLTLPLRQGYDDTYDRVYSVSDVRASSPTGAPANVYLIDERNWLTVRVGDENIGNVSGVQTYVISYTVHAVMNATTAAELGGTGDNVVNDELYWNAIGDGWAIPISNARVTVTSPQPVIQAQCFAGSFYSNEACRSMKVDGSTAVFSHPYLWPGQPFTVNLLYPPDTFATAPVLIESSDVARAFKLTWFSGISALVVLLGGLLLLVRKLRSSAIDQQYSGLTPGLAPAGNQELTVSNRDYNAPVAVQYEPPAGMRPGQIGTLVDEKADPRDVTATIVDMAVRGYIRIDPLEQVQGKAPKDYKLVKVREADPGMVPYEMTLYTALFEGRDQVDLSDLKTTFSTSMATAQSQLYADVTQMGWFRKNPQTARASWYGAGIGLVVLGLVGTFILAQFSSVALVPLALVVVGVATLFTGRNAPARTADGTAMLQQARGFELYLSTADANQLKYEEGHDIFSRYLPFAIAFGVADKWAKKFEDLAKQGVKLPEPTWYGASFAYGTFWAHSAGFGSQMAQFTSLADAAISAPTPGSSGGSGFSGGGGGGFSGGGGGGGGGGGW